MTQRVGGSWLFQAMALVMVVACLGSGLAGQVGAARLLYGMGRENVLPRRLFGHLSPRTSIPNYNVLLIGVLTLAAVAADRLRTGGHAAQFRGLPGLHGREPGHHRPNTIFAGAKESRGIVADLLVPGLGFLFCLVIWLSLPTPAKIAGGVWLLIGLVYDAVKLPRLPRPARADRFQRFVNTKWENCLSGGLARHVAARRFR